MKKRLVVLILTIILISSTCIFIFYNKKKENINLDVISKYLEINISSKAKIEYKDKHDSFFNEGYTIAKITDNNLKYKIENSNNWKNNDNEYTKKLHSIVKNMEKDYPEIKNINNYYWIYKSNYRDDNIKYIEDIKNKNIETYSYLVAIYDIDKNILYYYHMDM